MTQTSKLRAPTANALAAFLVTCTCLSYSAHAQPAPEQLPPEPTTPANPEPVVEPTAAAPAADAPLSAEEQAALAGEASETDTELLTALEMPSITAYGFADFSVHSQNAASLPTAFAGESPTFFIGNLNLYLRADLTKGWKSLAEVRFTYLPNGNIQADFTRQSTVVADYATFYTPSQWGGIMIQRAWLEYTVHPLLTIRAGHWLTPLGIWNVDHGTPTIIPAIRPFVVGAGMFPEAQTGFELYGSQYFGDTTLGYHLTLSNGRGNLDEYADMDKNKGIGGRLYATFNQLGTLTIGASAYGGRATDANMALDPTITMGPPYVQKIVLQYDEFVYAFDLLWKYSGFHLQAEFIAQSYTYTDAGRPAAGLPIYPGSLMPDDSVYGGYLLLAYELPWLPLMPFVQLDLSDFGSQVYISGQLDVEDVVVGPGLNYRPVESVTLKAQYYQGHYRPPEVNARMQDLRLFRFTAAWSF